MAISQVAGEEKAKVSAPKAPSAPAGNGTVQKKSDTKHAMFKAKGEQIGETLTAEQKEVEGTKRDAVAFVACLGDPAKPQPRKEGGVDIPSFTVVGYAFKALEDIKIFRAPLKANCKSLIDCEAPTEVAVKAGETFYLNIMEAGILISQPQFLGKFTGNGESVSLGIKFARDREEPLPILNKDTEGSIKVNMLEVANVIEDGENKTYQVKDEFADMFAVLYTKRSAGKKGSSGAGKKSEDASASLSRAFYDYINKKF